MGEKQGKGVMGVENTDIIKRIKHAARNTDALIAKLDTLTSRIDTARTNKNEELVQYYENQFTEVSVEFMDGVESILDGWYELRGEARPPAESEELTPEALEEIHGTVVSILQGLPVSLAPKEPVVSLTPKQAVGISSTRAPRDGGSRHKVDLTG
jgi:hypothetical protein